MQTSILPQKTCSVIGTQCTITDYAGVTALTQAWVAQLSAPEKKVLTIAPAASQPITLARHDPEFRKALSTFDMVVPDGMPSVWVMNWKGAGMKDRVYGPTLMLHVLALPGVSHFLLGGSEEMLETLKGRLREKFPEIIIAGEYSPSFSPTGIWPAEENELMLRTISESGAQCIWVGLGCPKQEYWIARNRELLPPGVYFAIGAAFAFHAGLVPQAPKWMQSRGLEWLFRLVSEPRRLWKRYLVFNSLFIWYLLVDAVFGEK